MTKPMSDIPKTKEKEKRQKGPIPQEAIYLTVGLIVVALAFFLPAFVLGYWYW